MARLAIIWNSQDPYATIEKGLVSRNKDSSGTHVFDPIQYSGIAPLRDVLSTKEAF
jgi:hypothetical protein